MAVPRKRQILVLAVCSVIWAVPFFVTLGNAMSLGSAGTPAARMDAWVLPAVLGLCFGFFVLMLILVGLGVNVGQPIGIPVASVANLSDVGPGEVVHSLGWVRLVTISLALTLGGLLGEGVFLVGSVSAGSLVVPEVTYLPLALVVCGLGVLGWGIWMRRRYPNRRSWRRGATDPGTNARTR